MSMDYSPELADYTLEQLSRPDGKPVFEHASLLLRLMYTLDVNNYVDFTKNRKKEALTKLFSSSTKEAAESLVLSEGSEAPFGGEWFMNVVLGKNVTLSTGTNILAHGGITLGDDCFISEQAQLVTVGHPIHPKQRYLILIGPVAIGKKAIVGADAIVLSTGGAEPVSVGRNSIVLPNAIVGKSTPDYSVSGGVNRVLLQGKEYFTNNTSTGKLADRLNAKGLEALQAEAQKLGIDLPEDVRVVPEKILPEGTRTVDHNAVKDMAKLGEFFPGTSEETLRMGLFFPPIFLAGSGQIELGESMLINTSTLLDINGAFVLGDGSFLAPEVDMSVPTGSKCIVGKRVWLGAKVKISVADNKVITIGDGSVVAAGAEITESVPPMSVVVGKGSIVKTLDEKDMHEVSPALNDFGIYEGQRIKVREYIGTLSPQEVESKITEHSAQPTVPDRFQELGKRLAKSCGAAC